jgi:hypothetical protein
MIPSPTLTSDDQAARLNKAKHHLEQRTDQTAANWLELADGYLKISSRANHAYCMTQAAKLGAPVSIDAPYEYEWMNEAAK